MSTWSTQWPCTSPLWRSGPTRPGQRARGWRHLASRRGLARDLPPPSADVPPPPAKARPGSAEDRAARKVLARVEKQLERIAVREAELHAEMEANLSDYDLLARVGTQLGELAAEKEELELEWLEASDVVE